MARLLRRGRANWLGCVTILRDKRRGGGGGWREGGKEGMEISGRKRRKGRGGEKRGEGKKRRRERRGRSISL